MKEKKFDLFGTQYTIKYVESAKDNDGKEVYGNKLEATKTIEVGLTLNGNRLPEDEIKLTELHEIFHAIFGEGGYASCHDDEPLVEWCAKCIRSLIKQKIV